MDINKNYKLEKQKEPKVQIKRGKANTQPWNLETKLANYWNITYALFFNFNNCHFNFVIFSDANFWNEP